jgi:DNA-binding NarL/FixJ family response regulator
VKLVVTIITFLIVDDSVSYRTLLRQLVQAQGNWSVVGEAADGVEAVKLALRFAPDVVLMDVTLPLMNGIEATRRIKHAAQKTHILVLSGYDEEEFRRESLLAGADYYLRKEDLDVELIKQLVAALFPSE